MSKLILKYGLIGGGIITGLMIVSLFFMMDELSYGTAEILGYLSMLIGFSTIYLAIKHVRDKKLDGTITFGRAFLVGILVTLIVTFLYVTTWMIFVAMSGDEFLDAFFQKAMEQIQNSGKTVKEINVEIALMKENAEMYRSPWVQLVVTFLEIFPVGLLVTLISAAILRKK